MQVALNPPSLGIGRLDQAGPRGLQLDQPGAELGLEALVLERKAGRRADRVDELGVVLEHGIVQQHGDRLPVALHERRAAGAAGLGKLDRPAVAVDVALLGREPEGELE